MWSGSTCTNRQTYNEIQYNEYNTMKYNTMNTIQWIQYNEIQYNEIQSIMHILGVGNIYFHANFDYLWTSALIGNITYIGFMILF